MRRIHREVWSLFLLYILIYYLFPFILNIIYPDGYDDIFVYVDSLLPIILVPFVLILVVIINYLIKDFKSTPFLKIGSIFENRNVNILIFLIFLVVSIDFSSKYGMNFRQSGGSTVSESGGAIIIMLALRSFSKVFFVYLLLKHANNIQILAWQRKLAGVASLCFALTLNVSVDILFIMFGLLFLLKKETFLFENREGILKSFKNKIFRIVLILAIGLGVVFIGNANKIGEDQALELFTDVDNIGKIILHTSKRISVWYVSVISIGNQYSLSSNELSLTAFEGVFSNLSSRFNLIMFGEKSEVNEVWSVNRLNFLEINKFTHNDRTGTSPGLVASGYYLPFFPFNFICIAFYTVFMLRYFSKSLHRFKGSFNLFGRFFLLFFLITLFDSPVDLINIISPSFVAVIFFLAAMDKIYALTNSTSQKII